MLRGGTRRGTVQTAAVGGRVNATTEMTASQGRAQTAAVRAPEGGPAAVG